MGRQYNKQPCDHVVEQGDWMSTIAKWYGFPKWKMIWDHPENVRRREEEKEKNPNKKFDPNILEVGMRIYIPSLEDKFEHKSTNKAYSFKVTREKVSLTIRLLDHEGEPRKSMKYKLIVFLSGEDLVIDGTTDGNGQFTEKIPAIAREAKLVLDGLPTDTGVNLLIGELDPVEKRSGAFSRLHNLGYDPWWAGHENGISAEMKSALRSFDIWEIQTDENERKNTDTLDLTKKDSLVKLHDKGKQL